MSRLINSAIACRDLQTSIEFYCEGLGLVVVVDHEFDSPFGRLMGLSDGRVHQVHLADPLDPGATLVELVQHQVPADIAAAGGPPFRGPFLIGFQCDFDVVVDRLGALGYTDIKQATVELPDSSPSPGERIKIGFLRDPDGTVVELVSQNFPTPSMQLRSQGAVALPSWQ